MVHDITIYKEFVRSIVHRVAVLHTATLVNALKNNYAETEYLTYDDCMNILYACQKEGKLLLTEDGIALTKGAYMRLVPDDYDLENIRPSQRLRIGRNIVVVSDPHDRAVMECVKVVADMMPYAYDFSTGFAPWYIQFIVHKEQEDPGILYQVTKVDLGSELSDEALLKGIISEPRFGWHDYSNLYSRIAILDNPEFAFAIPHLGFSKICVPDNSILGGLKIIETRDPEERWEDLNETELHE